MTPRDALRNALLLPLAGALLLACAEGPGEEIASGAELYRRHCAACHGADGSGGGPAAEALATPPGDLTGLARDAGGFDARAVAATIDGRARIPAHGSAAMPVWGEVFAEELAGEPHARRVAALRVIAIVDHLRSIQR